MEREPKPILGYCDQISVAPGARLRFFVSCEGASEFRADIVRLPEKSKEQELGDETDQPAYASLGMHPAIRQTTYPGSALIVDQRLPQLARGFTFQAMLFATVPASRRRQTIAAEWSPDSGVVWALYLEQSGRLAFRYGDTADAVVGLRPPLLTRVWYLVWATLDRSLGRAAVGQQPILAPFNGRLAQRPPGVSLEASASVQSSANASVYAPGWLSLAAGQGLDLKRTTAVTIEHFDGKIDRPRLAGRALSAVEVRRAIEEPLEVPGMVAAWDAAADGTKQRLAGDHVVWDAGPAGLHGRLRNTPTRGVTGYNWDGSEYSFRHAPEQYGAIHFHSDDISDCMWVPSFEFTVPPMLASGIYAARVTATSGDHRSHDHIPFFVRPGPKRRRARLVFLAPTATYLAYANDMFAADSAATETGTGAVAQMDTNALARQQHREYGASLYDCHTDGSGICYASWLRPLLTVRPDVRHPDGHLWHLPADLQILDWLEQTGYPVDVLTDHDLHREGETALRDYRLVVTGSHPEYYSGAMLDALTRYVSEQGGRLMYLGGNGFYWVTGFLPEDPRIIEVRRFGGTEAWTAEPGQEYLSSTGEMGGIWRNRGRAPQKLVGVGFIAQGLDRSTYFQRRPDSYLPETNWIFDGLPAGERIGDFSSGRDGPAGLEIDWYDPDLGSPDWAYLLAASVGHTRYMLEARENFGMTVPHTGGDMNPNIRGEVVYYKTASGGAVFSVGSVAWGSALSRDASENNVSRVTRNVLERFSADAALP